MKSDLKQEAASGSDDENTKGWTKLYLIVVGALVAQIAFFAWLTQAFE